MATDSHLTVSKPVQDFLLAIQRIWDYLLLQTTKSLLIQTNCQHHAASCELKSAQHNVRRVTRKKACLSEILPKWGWKNSTWLADAKSRLRFHRAKIIWYNFMLCLYFLIQFSNFCILEKIHRTNQNASEEIKITETGWLHAEFLLSMKVLCTSDTLTISKA